MVEILLTEEEESAEKDLQLNFSFPKKLKIRKKLEYKSLYKSCIRLKGSNIYLDYRFNEKLELPRIGITISSKTAKAHLRNKFKRIIKEIFRLNRHKLNKSLEIHILAKSMSQDMTYIELEKDFLNLMNQIKKLS
ncbi:MAG: Ribonuclease P protein component [Candidatus Anoxychlamydiales bacterium]|nr:Ribonuclease P protein component [Candidatus Anoxychlamydiales bacterium]